MERKTIERVDRPGREELDRLLSGVAAGDREALAELYRASRGAVYAMALSILKNAHDAQDVTQDAFVRVWECAGQYRAQGSPMAWLLTLTRNLARMRLRQTARQQELSEEEWAAIPAESSGLEAEDRAAPQAALSCLGDTERQVVLLHAVSGLKHREIAGVLELSLPTVLSKYHRALKKLRAKLEGDDAL